MLWHRAFSPRKAFRRARKHNSAEGSFFSNHHFSVPTPCFIIVMAQGNMCTEIIVKGSPEGKMEKFSWKGTHFSLLSSNGYGSTFYKTSKLLHSLKSFYALIQSIKNIWTNSLLLWLLKIMLILRHELPMARTEVCKSKTRDLGDLHSAESLRRKEVRLNLWTY